MNSLFVLQLTLIGIGAFLLYGGWSTDRRKLSIRLIRAGYARQEQMRQNRIERDIHQRDPEFSKDNLCERIWQAFRRLHVAWSERDPKRIRSFVSDGFYERMLLEIEIEKACGIRKIWSDIEIRNVRVARIESNAVFDSIHFQVTARARVGIFDAETATRIGDLPDCLDVFSEHWTFLRRCGAVTKSKPGMIEGFCPKCGARLGPDSDVGCRACNAILCSGEFDWVLTDIKPVSERIPLLRHGSPGMEDFANRGPDFSMDHVRDRISSIFHRLTTAEFLADERLLYSAASERFLEAQAEKWRNRDGARRVFADAVLCSSEIIRFRSPSDREPGFDEIDVLVKWCGREVASSDTAYILPEDKKRILFLQTFRLIRKQNVESAEKRLLIGSHCPGCGTWAICFQSPRCCSCGTPIGDGSSDWSLDEILPFDGFPHQPGMSPFECARTSDSFLHKQQSPLLPTYDHEILFASLAATLLPNGIEENAELRELIGNFARVKGVSTGRLSDRLDADRNGRGAITRPETLEDARVLVRSLIHVCLMDGKLSRIEENVLGYLVRKMGYGTWDISEIAEMERNCLLRDAKAIVSSETDTVS
jgi:hypothetical protein